MLMYAVLMFLMAAIFLWIGINIHRGKNSLIHDYHQAKVKEEDKKAYGKAFANGIFLLSASLGMRGLISLLGETKETAIYAVIMLAVGFLISFTVICKRNTMTV